MNFDNSTHLQNYLVKEAQAPDSIFYIPNFIGEDEEQEVLKKIYGAPKPKWVTLSNRRLQNWGGLPHQKGMIAEPIPNWLQKHMTKIDELQPFGDKSSNHVLVNEYLPNQGIMPHVDGPIFYPTITTITLGSHTLLDLYVSSEQEETICDTACKPTLKLTRKGSLLLEPRSLLVLQKDAYEKFLHGIREKHEDLLDKDIFNLNKTNYSVGNCLTRGTRVSLTIRHFPKVLKTKIFGFKTR